MSLPLRTNYLKGETDVQEMITIRYGQLCRNKYVGSYEASPPPTQGGRWGEGESTHPDLILERRQVRIKSKAKSQLFSPLTVPETLIRSLGPTPRDLDSTGPG